MNSIALTFSYTPFPLHKHIRAIKYFPIAIAVCNVLNCVPSLKSSENYRLKNIRRCCSRNDEGDCGCGNGRGGSNCYIAFRVLSPRIRSWGSWETPREAERLSWQHYTPPTRMAYNDSVSERKCLSSIVAKWKSILAHVSIALFFAIAFSQWQM